MDERESTEPRMSAFSRFRRRQLFLINKPLQARLLLASFRHILIVLVVLGGALFLPSIIGLQTNDEGSNDALRAAGQLLFLHSHFWTAALLATILITLDSIRISHRIAGPLHRFDMAIGEACEGRIPDPIRLRDGDLLQDVCQHINEATDEARKRQLESSESAVSDDLAA